MHDMLCVEMLAQKVLVVCECFDFMTKKNGSVFFQCFHDAEKLALSSGTPGLSQIEFSAMEGNGFPILETMAPDWQ